MLEGHVDTLNSAGYVESSPEAEQSTSFADADAATERIWHVIY